MKRSSMFFTLAAVALQFSAVAAQSVWTAVSPLPQTNGLTSVVFPDANTGYAAGDAGTIIKTLDGGKTWTVSRTGKAGDGFSSIAFADVNTGVAVGGDEGVTWKTTDGGASWDNVSGKSDNALIAICFTDANIGYMVGQYATIRKTETAGKKWFKQKSGFEKDKGGNILTTVFFSDAKTGYATGRIGEFPKWTTLVFKTTDGGEKWVAQKFGDSEPVNGLWFTDNNTGYAVGNGILSKTTNGGSTWESCSYKYPGLKRPKFRSVCFADANTGFAVGGDGVIYKTENAGANWVSQESGTAKTLWSVCCTKGGSVFVVGDNGIILTSTVK